MPIPTDADGGGNERERIEPGSVAWWVPSSRGGFRLRGMGLIPGRVACTFFPMVRCRFPGSKHSLNCGPVTEEREPNTSQNPSEPCGPPGELGSSVPGSPDQSVRPSRDPLPDPAAGRCAACHCGSQRSSRDPELPRVDVDQGQDLDAHLEGFTGNGPFPRVLLQGSPAPDSGNRSDLMAGAMLRSVRESREPGDVTKEKHLQM